MQRTQCRNKPLIHPEAKQSTEKWRTNFTDSNAFSNTVAHFKMTVKEGERVPGDLLLV